ncbi:hypothetical protein UFOVP1357_28 [uncultured Caudovirales phage]|uniref:Uncharacterized protein n=1 Tax=uncultured Caudovirales phage TaxID=2100421 RepID=A0A6J5MKB0_9CAUD|nr:hypothetical protein UFOVP18_45 [uncultured Caudovirales phage]CAB4127042.1 hypothetical protein UFOVP82_47 [uncultured Caudovirales phage]CAB4132593.1 hypothetical protein UFOVP258_38 [uncultured Caudovirales phage]CAB4146491.1 hypothetical protein UFOVP502_30 [uncultured Caudovirales phage]CAB4200086.1 hypothetical protein UFOVP1357_28 [uncultured Caudovirales phage]
MNLSDYIRKREITTKKFAREIGYGVKYIQTIINLRMKPGLKLAKIIEKHTRGMVSVADMMDVELITYKEEKEVLEEFRKKKATADKRV